MLPVPEIKRRVNTRARRLKLRVEQHQVCLTVPPCTSEAQVQQFLKQSESWLLRTWSTHYADQGHTQQPQTDEVLSFPLLAQAFVIRLTTDLTSIECSVKHGQLMVPTADAAASIKQWIRQQARVHLSKRLEQLAMQHDFTYTGCQVRHAKTRWGSCSARHAISLNAALLLMPVELMDYVILHELCHTRELNHSSRFWQQMQRVDSNYLHHRQQLKTFKLPGWWHSV